MRGEAHDNAAVDFAISEEDTATLRSAGGTDYGAASKFPVFGKPRHAECAKAEG